MSGLRSTLPTRAARGVGAPSCLAAPHSLAFANRSFRVVCQASDGNDNTDWDAAWRSFQKQVRSQVDTRPVAGTSSQPSITRRLPHSSQDQLRRQERVLLDLWTSEDALKWGSMALVAGLLVVLLSAGAPIDDGRCTLPCHLLAAVGASAVVLVPLTSL